MLLFYEDHLKSPFFFFKYSTRGKIVRTSRHAMFFFLRTYGKPCFSKPGN